MSDWAFDIVFRAFMVVAIFTVGLCVGVSLVPIDPICVSTERSVWSNLPFYDVVQSYWTLHVRKRSEALLLTNIMELAGAPIQFTGEQDRKAIVGVTTSIAIWALQCWRRSRAITAG